MRLVGKSALITGAGGGIGRAIALVFAEEGALVSLNDYDRGFPKTQEVALQIQEKGGRAMAVEADVADQVQVERMVKVVLEEYGAIDILVNNAGICPLSSIMEISLEEWNRVLAVNLTGVFLCSKAVMRQMIERGKGKIINIASIAGKVGGIITGAHYAASKAGVIAFTKSLAAQLAPHGINVNGIAPGPIETDITRGFPIEGREKLLTAIPLGKFGRPEDVATAALFLASEDAEYITGEILDVNGGLLMD